MALTGLKWSKNVFQVAELPLPGGPSLRAAVAVGAAATFRVGDRQSACVEPDTVIGTSPNHQNSPTGQTHLPSNG